jgi:hypothetical protein
MRGFGLMQDAAPHSTVKLVRNWSQVGESRVSLEEGAEGFAPVLILGAGPTLSERLERLHH